MSQLLVLDCGPCTTVQDFGRLGWSSAGIPESGAMDKPALASANTLVGNSIDEAGIELALLGGSFQASGGDLNISLCGARTKMSIDGRVMADHTNLQLHDGETLVIGPARDATFMYLAVAGGLDVPSDFGSRSSDQRARLGFKNGAAIATGDRLSVRQDTSDDRQQRSLQPVDYIQTRRLRVVLGPQEDYFSANSIEQFLTAPYLVSARSNRMAYELEGPEIPWRLDREMISDATLPGSIQVPRNGRPLVMMSDRQTVGGYPKIATVIPEDLHWLAQTSAGASTHFEAISARHAHEIAITNHRSLMKQIKRRLILEPHRSFFIDRVADAAVDATNESTWL